MYGSPALFVANYYQEIIRKPGEIKIICPVLENFAI
jgi:hypothetical protein